MAKSQYQLIEIIDSFDEEYQMEDLTKESLSQNLDEFKALEEEKIIKRYEMGTSKHKFNFYSIQIYWNNIFFFLLGNNCILVYFL